MILFGSNFRFQEPSVMLVASLTNFGVKIQVPQVFLKFFTRDLVLFFSYEAADILFCESLVIYEYISYYGSQSFSLHSPRASLPLVICSSPHRTGKEEDIMHPPRHLLLTLGADFTTHGFLFVDETYHFIYFSPCVMNPQEPFLTYQLISVALHGSSLHLAAIYIYDLVEHIILLPKRNIPPDIMMERFTC